jgi:hypothetical protein
MMVRAGCHNCAWTTKEFPFTNANEWEVTYLANNHSGIHQGQHVTYVQKAESFFQPERGTAVADIASY